MTNRDAAIEAAMIDSLLALLREHHNWHLQSGAIGLQDGQGGWIEIDNAAEYCDSGMYDRTASVLEGAPPQEQMPIPRGGFQTWWWEQAVLLRRKLREAEKTIAAYEQEHRSELKAINDMLDEGQGDDDGPDILPDFEPGMSVLAKVDACLHLLEMRRDVIAAYEQERAKEAVEVLARPVTYDGDNIIIHCECHGDAIRTMSALRASRPAPAADVKALREALQKPGLMVFLDGQNEHGSHVLASLPNNLVVDDCDPMLAENAEAIIQAAESAGYQIGDHVWTEWRWNEPQYGDFGRVEISGHWEFVGVNKTATAALATSGGGE